jgi:magnesium chelatase subunit I
MTKATTLRELKQTEWASPSRIQRTVKDEMRENLVCLLENGSPLFPGIVGYEETVIPHLVNAILSRHNFILLGLRGQAKSRLLRQLVTLLDDEIPIIGGSEVNDHPFHPISKYGRELLARCGDDTPIAWIPRESRFVEKLATPDVTIADIIGDVDPIKAARGGHLLSDELTMHFGLLPRANRGIFAFNELPDLAGKVQVGLFNIMQEGDVQIKGYPVRLNLDIALVFTANPEDYTARGKIITPLKDRIGSEIGTHYPAAVELGAAITRQEAWVQRNGRPLQIPDFIAELVERVAFEARADKRVDRRSGVSQRLPITLLENAVSNAERRAITTKERSAVPRVSDVYAALPAITGKLELEYEGELQGPEVIAKELIRRAAGKTFEARVGGANVDDIIHWFDEGGALKISVDERSDACLKGFSVVPGLVDLVTQVGLAGRKDPATMVSACELVLEGLVAEKRISRSEELGYTRARPEGRGPGGAGGGGGSPYGKSGPGAGPGGGAGGGGGPTLFT